MSRINATHKVEMDIHLLPFFQFLVAHVQLKLLLICRVLSLVVTMHTMAFASLALHASLITQWVL